MEKGERKPENKDLVRIWFSILWEKRGRKGRLMPITRETTPTRRDGLFDL